MGNPGVSTGRRTTAEGQEEQAVWWILTGQLFKAKEGGVAPCPGDPPLAFPYAALSACIGLKGIRDWQSRGGRHFPCWSGFGRPLLRLVTIHL